MFGSNYKLTFFSISMNFLILCTTHLYVQHIFLCKWHEKALCKENLASVSAFMLEAREYLISLKTLDDNPLLRCKK